MVVPLSSLYTTRRISAYPSRAPDFTPGVLVGTMLLFSFACCPIMCLSVLSCCCDVRYDFHIKRCSIRLCLQLFVGRLLSDLRYLCLFAYIAVQHISCCFSSSCVTCVASLSGLSIFDCYFAVF